MPIGNGDERMTTKQQEKLKMLRDAVAARGAGNNVEVIGSLPTGRLSKSKFPLDSSVIYVLVNGRGHVAISANGAIELPFVRSFPGSYFEGAVSADQLEARCDPNGFKIHRGSPAAGVSVIPSSVSTLLVTPSRSNVATKRLVSYFARDGQQRALDAYGKFISGKGWGVQFKMELYEHSPKAFDPCLPQDSALAEFEKIDSDLWSHWGLGRNSSGPHWTAKKTFETIRSEFSGVGWGSPVTLPKFQSSATQSTLASSLEKMRGLKSVTRYPVMAVSKFLHFYNPELFPIYDTEVIWNGVFRCFRNDFKEYCDRSGVRYHYEDTASFLWKYISWASSLMASAHPEFMQVFLYWLDRQPGADLKRRTFDASRLFATAFEFTAIGAWRSEIAAGD